MSSSNWKSALAIVSSLMVAGPISAQSPAPATTTKPTTTPDDLNKLICQKVEVIGSRLAVKKICMTQSQWDQARLQDRQFVEKIQASPCVTTGPRRC